MDKVILFGASTRGQTAYKNLIKEYEIVYFADNNEAKWGEELCGIEIIPPHSLISLKDDCQIIITSQYDIAIASQLLNMGITKFGVYHGDFNRVDYFDYSNIEKIQEKKNQISLIMSNNSGSSTYALYKMMPPQYQEKYNVILINENKKDNNYYLNLLESKLIVHTHSNYYDNTKINVQLWHGFPLKGLSYMSNHVTKEQKDYNHREWEKLDLIISYSQTYSTLMNACHGLDGNKYFVAGMPRNDFLFNTDGKKILSELLGINLTDKKVIFYMPTFRKTVFGEENGQEDQYNLLDIPGFDEKLFDTYLEENNIAFIIKYHPVHVYQDKKVKNVHILKDDHLRDKDLELYEIINAADLLITDYSSIYFDYLLLDRPIIFTPLDLEAYTENRGFLLEPYDFWAPGPKCYNFEQLAAEIIICLNDNSYYQKERETICNIVHHYKDANSSERVWKVIDQLMSKS